MAERRMFSKAICESDSFCDMPLSAQALYFHLSLNADDDGFLGNARKIRAMIGASEDDLKLLIAKNFLIPYHSGVIVVKHWRQNNYLRNDRHKATIYQDELSMLEIKANGTYELKDSCGIPENNQPYTVGIPNGYQMETQYSKGEISKEKLSRDKTYCTEPENSASVPATVIELILNNKSLYPITQQDIDEWSSLYPAVDVMQELRKMKGWLDANPTKRKTSRGIKRFVNSWLAKEQDKGGAKIYGEKNTETESTSSVRLW